MSIFMQNFPKKVSIFGMVGNWGAWTGGRDMEYVTKETKLKPNEVGSIWKGGAVE